MGRGAGGKARVISDKQKNAPFNGRTCFGRPVSLFLELAGLIH
jgi:hypothetical protein